jgi:putative SOS response-associated peptidase YedK
MCGRYTNTPTDPKLLGERFELNKEVAADGLGRAIVSRTQQVLAVVRERDGERHPVMLRWGLAPRWGTLKGGRRSSTRATTRSRPPTPGSR